jgi:hypothetical protein
MSRRKNRLNGRPRLVPNDIPVSCPPPIPEATVVALESAVPCPAQTTTFGPACEVGQGIELSCEEKDGVRAVQNVKTEALLRAGEMEAQKLTFLLAARDADAEMVRVVHGIMRAHGIDPDDKSRGWNFQVAGLKLVRTK